MKFATDMVHNIERANESNSASDVIAITSSDSADFLVFDWESDSSIGSLPVPVDVDITSSCVVVNHTGTTGQT